MSISRHSGLVTAQHRGGAQQRLVVAADASQSHSLPHVSCNSQACSWSSIFYSDLKVLPHSCSKAVRMCSACAQVQPGNGENTGVLCKRPSLLPVTWMYLIDGSSGSISHCIIGLSPSCLFLFSILSLLCAGIIFQINDYPQVLVSYSVSRVG